MYCETMHAPLLCEMMSIKHDCDFPSLVGVQVKQLLRKKQCSSVMMAYGISAAGKTHTIEVGHGAFPGLCGPPQGKKVGR